MVRAPFTDEQVIALQKWQDAGVIHPFTCCSHDGCERSSREDHGVLIPTKEGWICPCGKWKQDWCHDFMIKPVVDPFERWSKIRNKWLKKHPRKKKKPTKFRSTVFINIDTKPKFKPKRKIWLIKKVTS